MCVFVADHRHVVIVVHARRVEGVCDWLLQVHVCGGGYAVGRRDLVRVVMRGECLWPADDVAGLRVVVFRVVFWLAGPRPKLNFGML